MSELDQIIGAFDRLSLLAQLRDKVITAHHAGLNYCGDCYFWMKSRSCPREKNVNGLNYGPSCEAPICSKFQRKQSSIENQQRLIADAIAFADEHSLPRPSYLAHPSPEPRKDHGRDE